MGLVYIGVKRSNKLLITKNIFKQKYHHKPHDKVMNNRLILQIRIITYQERKTKCLETKRTNLTHIFKGEKCVLQRKEEDKREKRRIQIIKCKKEEQGQRSPDLKNFVNKFATVLFIPASPAIS